MKNTSLLRADLSWCIGARPPLFGGSSDKAGWTTAVLMSLCTACKYLGISPRAYLRDVLGQPIVMRKPCGDDLYE